MRPTDAQALAKLNSMPKPAAPAAAQVGRTQAVGSQNIRPAGSTNAGGSGSVTMAPRPPVRPTSLGTTTRPPAASTATKPGVVSKSDLDTYRKNVGNPNATLGQYMNDLKGLTARKGGANDPSVIQKRLDPKGLKAFDPSKAEKAQGPEQSAAPAPATPRTDSSVPGASTAVTTPKGGSDAMTPNYGRESDPLDRTNSPVSGSRHQGGAGLDNEKEAKNRTSQNSQIAESVVSVGANKYRIV